MLGLEKIKKSFGDVLKEHPYSILLFFIGTLLWALDIGARLFETPLECGRSLFMGVSLGVLLCETIGLYRAEKKGEDIEAGKFGRVLLNIVIVLGSLAATLLYWLFNEYNWQKKSFGSDYMLYQELTQNVFICVMTAILGFTVFFFYKRRNDSFEEYTARAFCGLMKAQLVYGIIAIGFLLVLVVFNVLIYDTEQFDLIARSQILILGLVEFPCVIAGLSRTEEKISKFGKAVLSYVLTALLSLGFIIIYVYIIKILVTWKFPSNEVFSILTGLFVGGVAVWTMAQGCCDENLKKFYNILPILFIPFIVLQVMCLYMRVVDYGFTMNRYFGAALIVFEIVYFLLYIFKMISRKDIMAWAIFLVIAGSVLILLFPGTNMNYVVTASQKKKIEKLLAMGDADYKMKAAAAEAYKEIKKHGGFAGKMYFEKGLTPEQLSDIKNIDPSNVKSDDFYIRVNNNMHEIDISGYSKLYVYHDDYSIYDKGFEVDAVLLSYGDDNNIKAKANLRGVVDKLIENDKNDASEEENIQLLREGIILSNGSKLLIREITLDGEAGETNKIDRLVIDGYILK